MQLRPRPHETVSCATLSERGRLLTLSQDESAAQWDAQRGRRMVTCTYDPGADRWDCTREEEEEEEEEDRRFAQGLELTETFRPFPVAAARMSGRDVALAMVETNDVEDCGVKGSIVKWEEGKGGGSPWVPLSGDAVFHALPVTVASLTRNLFPAERLRCAGFARLSAGQGDLEEGDANCWNGGSFADVEDDEGGVRKACLCRGEWEGENCRGRKRNRDGGDGGGDVGNSARGLAIWSRRDGSFSGLADLLQGGAYSASSLSCSLPDLPSGWRPAFGFQSGETLVFCGGSSGGQQQATERCVKLDPASSSWSPAPSMLAWRGQTARAFSPAVPALRGAPWVVGGDTVSRCSFRRAERASSETLGPDGRWSDGPGMPPPNRPVSCFADAGANRTFVATIFHTSWNQGSEFWTVDWTAGGGSLRRIPSAGRERELRRPLCAALTPSEAAAFGAVEADGAILVMDGGNSKTPFLLLDPSSLSAAPAPRWTALKRRSLPPLKPYQEKLLLARAKNGRLVLATNNRGRDTVSLYELSGDSWQPMEEDLRIEAPRRQDAILVEMTEEVLSRFC